MFKYSWAAAAAAAVVAVTAAAAVADAALEVPVIARELLLLLDTTCPREKCRSTALFFFPIGVFGLGIALNRRAAYVCFKPAPSYILHYP